MKWSIASALGLCASSALAYPSKGAAPARRQTGDAGRVAAVKEAFEFSWNGYREFAFPNDELKPVSNGFGNSRNAWGASAVDALSTAILLEERDIVNFILDYVPSINFEETETEVSLFETTIRYLGGLVSAYDLLKGPYSGLVENAASVDTLLTQARNLAEALKFAFDTPTGIPHNALWFTNDTFADGDSTGLAVSGTLVLEWTRLSDLLGDPQYQVLTERAESFLLKPSPASAEPFPGLVGSDIQISTGQFLNNRGGWSGGTDSFYEYLIKMYVYDPTQFANYRDRWIAAADSTIEFLTSNPVTRPALTFVAEYSGTNLSLNSGHLTCFHGGNFLLGGTVLSEQKYIDYGLRLVDGCHATYNSTATQIGPERWSWNPDNVPAEQRAFFETNGFYITTEYYNLRPEVIESYYHAYRITGDAKYAEWVWDAFTAINGTARRGSGFTAIENVNVAGGGGDFDNQESFWFAEVLKYAFLTFAPQDLPIQVSKDGKNQFVFNTEAHPFKVKTFERARMDL